MPKMTTYTVIWIDSDKTTKAVLDYETFDNRSALEARVIALSSQSVQYTVVTGAILEVTIDTSPRVTIGAAAPAVDKPKKPRAPRSDKGQPRRGKPAPTSVPSNGEVSA